MEWMQKVVEVVEPAIWSAVGLLLLWLMGVIMAKMAANAATTQVVDLLRQGVDKAQEEFVTWRKRAAADGKLTQEERYEAMRIAYRYAMEMVSGPAMKVLASWSWEKVQSIIKQLVEKKKAAETKTTVIIESEADDVDDDPKAAGAAAVAGAVMGGDLGTDPQNGG